MLGRLKVGRTCTVTTNYKNVQKIWSSKLSTHNKYIAHVFAMPILTLIFGVTDWIIQKIENVDITTTKIEIKLEIFTKNQTLAGCTCQESWVKWD